MKATGAGDRHREDGCARLPRSGAGRQQGRGRENLRQIAAAGDRPKKKPRSSAKDSKPRRCNAALANGTAAHAMDFDHSFTTDGPTHRADHSGDLCAGRSARRQRPANHRSLRRRLRGHGKLVHSLRDSEHDGWHAPSTLGSFGAAAACAKLLGLNAAQIEMALGITASMAGGVVANFGTMTKPLHVGLGARNGVLAAKLAQAGFTANAKAIEIGLWLLQSASCRHADRRGADRRIGPVLRAAHRRHSHQAVSLRRADASGDRFDIGIQSQTRLDSGDGRERYCRRCQAHFRANRFQSAANQHPGKVLHALSGGAGAG